MASIGEVAVSHVSAPTAHYWASEAETMTYVTASYIPGKRNDFSECDFQEMTVNTLFHHRAPIQ